MNKIPKYLVTGATGYIGRMFVNKLLKENKETDITVIVRNTEKAYSFFEEKVHIIECDITDTEKISEIQGEFDYILHFAAPTKSRFMVLHPVETMNSLTEGTKNILELSKRCKAKSVVYISSMEVYGVINTTGRVTEDMQGYIDTGKARSCYPMGKRTAEQYCTSYCREYNVPVKIVRLAQTFGKGVLPEENRVFAQFAKAVINGTDIVLHTSGNSMGNYCDIEDALNGIMTVLYKGRDGEAYNIVNEDNTMTINEMAELVAVKVAENHIRVVHDIPDENIFGYAEDTGLKLSSEKIEKLGFKPSKTLYEMYVEMISCLV